jgi:hypothetical protein
MLRACFRQRPFADFHHEAFQAARRFGWPRALVAAGHGQQQCPRSGARRFRLEDPHAIALSLKRSAERSRRRKTTPFRSAMSMLNFFINRAGSQLAAEQRDRLEAAKDELRALYDRPRRH